MLTLGQYSLVGLASVAAGMVNALAGGGSLITFPTLVAVGIPPVAANVTNTVALCPGYLGAAIAQKKDLKGQKHRLYLLLPAGAFGGILGGILLLNTSERLFDILVPFLILLASGLLAFQDPLRGWLNRRQRGKSAGVPESWAILPILIASIYGGYFGAGLSVIELAVLGVFLPDNLTRLNALKQVLSLVVNVAAALFFLFSGKVVWSVAIVVAIGALVGGLFGGKLAGRISPSALRWTVVSIGVVISILYFRKL
ncbi:sulfite exporter TauE/SafE family protein [Pannus brasiliensis CCIBt3594]|uniref:Probable membrane transporter protein n=1 Tax=Pannus brasiliensis CCIBt3594 TaxID=1427578 RepID=A0AAW9QT17_9CHRO